MRDMAGRMPAEALLTYLFGESQHRLRAQVAAWLAESPRFRGFVEEQRDKIRKKARVAGEEEARRDLLVELGVGRHLLRDKRISLAYEPLASQKTRGPDYVATFTTRFSFAVEVTRLRASGEVGRWADVLCAKLLQLPPGQPNVVVVATAAGQCAEFDPAQPVALLRGLLERKDDAYFAQRGWRDARDFARQWPRLSALGWWDGWDAPTGGVWSLWINPQAKHPLPQEGRVVMSGG